MKISAIGEFGLIDRFSKKFIHGLGPGVVGIGDDCAVIPQDKTQSSLITTDMLVEDIHFLRKHISPKDLGHKSLAVNFSDIAAMGGEPLHAFLSLGLPSTTSVEWIDDFFEGFGALVHEYGVQLLGGDTTRSSGPIIINVAVVGKAHSKRVKLRSSAQPGDIICVTGYLGDSAAGLKAILENCSLDSDVQYLIHRHHHPSPHLRQGKWLAERAGVNAMMDISDGINSDLRRIMERSKCGCTIQLDQIPISPALHRFSLKTGWNVLELAVSGGEDYCLLVTVDQSSYERLSDEYYKNFQHQLFRIGEITNQPGNLMYLKAGKPFHFNIQGFEHFPTESRKEPSDER